MAIETETRVVRTERSGCVPLVALGLLIIGYLSGTVAERSGFNKKSEEFVNWITYSPRKALSDAFIAAGVTTNPDRK